MSNGPARSRLEERKPQSGPASFPQAPRLMVPSSLGSTYVAITQMKRTVSTRDADAVHKHQDRVGPFCRLINSAESRYCRAAPQVPPLM